MGGGGVGVQFLEGWQSQSSRDPVEKRRKEYYGYDDIRRKRTEEEEGEQQSQVADDDNGLPELSPQQHVSNRL